MKTHAYKVSAGETCKIDLGMGKSGINVEGPAVIVVVKEGATTVTIAPTLIDGVDVEKISATLQKLFLQPDLYTGLSGCKKKQFGDRRME